MASHTDPLGNTTSYSYTGANLTSINYPNVSNPASQTSVAKQFQYNGKGQVTQITDEDGKIVTNEYFAAGTNAVGLLKKTKVNPGGLTLTTEYAYNSENQLSTVTDPLGKVTTFTFDDIGRKIEVVDPLGIQTQWHYDGNGNVTSMDVENLDKDGNAVSGNGWLTTSYTYSTHDDMLTMTEEIDVDAHADDDLRVRRQSEPNPGDQTRVQQGEVDLQLSQPRGDARARRDGGGGLDGHVHVRQQREPDPRSRTGSRTTRSIPGTCSTAGSRRPMRSGTTRRRTTTRRATSPRCAGTTPPRAPMCSSSAARVPTTSAGVTGKRAICSRTRPRRTRTR